MVSTADTGAEWIVLGRSGDGVTAVELDAGGSATASHALEDAQLHGWIAERESTSPPRWVWSNTPAWYTGLLTAGIRFARCHDLRLVHAILRDSQLVGFDHGLRAATEWDAPGSDGSITEEASLFDLDAAALHRLPDSIELAEAEFARQRATLESEPSGRLQLLAAAESAGALLAVELRAAGLPWDAASHEAILTATLGARSGLSAEPERLAQLGARVRDALGDPSLSLDSQPKLLRALHRVGVMAESTSRSELARHQHPAIEPLIEYKRLWRLWTANGWTWLDGWVRDGRFRPVYVPAGVVTGRWASSGGGALQIPRQLRQAVRADPGWTFVVADVAQLEPRVLAAMSRDAGMAEAARGRDLYAGIVASGTVETRARAKVALLGAMYGATAGEGGRLMPQLRRSYPAAMGLVDDAARIGEEGGVVTTWLGRSCPPASAGWRTAQATASEAGASAGDQTRARRWARDRGRFTRNFVVQGTAAEWALVWLADLRARLHDLPSVSGSTADRSGPVFATRAHIALFLHDEILVHTPTEYADTVADAVREAAASAGRRLFGAFPVDFALDVRVAESAAAED